MSRWETTMRGSGQIGSSVESARRACESCRKMAGDFRCSMADAELTSLHAAIGDLVFKGSRPPPRGPGACKLNLRECDPLRVPAMGTRFQSAAPGLIPLCVSSRSQRPPAECWPGTSPTWPLVEPAGVPPPRHSWGIVFRGRSRHTPGTTCTRWCRCMPLLPVGDRCRSTRTRA